MNMRVKRIAPMILSACIIAAPALAPAQNKPAPPAPTGATQLADRLESMAFDTPATHKQVPAVMHEVVPLLRAASKLNPSETRYLRLLYELDMKAGDTQGAAEALKTYLTAMPDDQYAQAKLIDVYVSRMQTVESILSYLHGIVIKTQLPAPVRSHAAYLCAQTLMDHAQKDEALKMLDSAVQINPLDVDALRMKLRLTPDAGASRRCGLLLAIMRADPMDAEAATTLAGELAQLGLAEDSAVWYTQAANIYQIEGQARSPEIGRGGATELYLLGHPMDAAKVADDYLSAVPSDADAWAIRLAIAKDVGSDPASFNLLAAHAVREVTNRFQAVRARIGASNATTQPSDTSAAGPTASAQINLFAPPSAQPATQPTDNRTLAAVPDLTADMALLVKANQDSLTDAYIGAAGDLAWLRLCYLRDSSDDTQRIVDALAKLLPADDVLLARLSGWNYLVRGKWDEARQKLSAVADRDPYAAMGMALLDNQAGDKTAADALARTTLATHPYGAAAATLFSEFRTNGAKVIPTGQAQAVKAEVDAFPRDWLNVVSDPQSFYTVTADPEVTPIENGQAVLGRVTLRNTGEYDLTLGDAGVIKPGLLFDASSRGLVEKSMPGVVFDIFWRRLVLKRGESVSEIIRMDHGLVEQLLGERPEVPIDLMFTVTTNPVQTAKSYGLGPAGYQTQFGGLLERSATPISTDDERKVLFKHITDGPAPQRLSATETAVAFALGLRMNAQGDNADTQLTIGKEMSDHARQALADADPYVRTYAEYLFAITSPPEQLSLVQRLTTSDNWYSRMMGLVAAQRLPDGGQRAASALSSDADPIVKAYALAMMDYNTQVAAAATQPAAK